MGKKYDKRNPFHYKVKIKEEIIQVKMIHKRKAFRIKREFIILFNDWSNIERLRSTPYNTYSMKYRLLSRYIDPLFSQEERLYSEYMDICMDAGKAIDKAFGANGVSK